MAVLITGAGLVGTFAARQLMEAGLEPVLFELAPNEEGIASVLGDASVSLVQGDLLDRNLLLRTLRDARIDTVIHTAGLLTAGAQKAPLRAVDVNVGGTAGLIDACQQAGVRRIVFCSSVLVYYGMLARADAPIPGDFGMRVVSERPPLVYAATKLACEHIGAVYGELAGIEFVSLRFGALFGPWLGPVGGVTGMVFRTLVEQALAGRVDVRDPDLVWRGAEDFTYVRDAADAVVKAATSPESVGGAHNITMGALYTFEQVLEMIRMLRPEASIVYDIADKGGIAGFKFQRNVPNDVSSAERFGWSPKYMMNDALEDYLEWCENRSTIKSIID